MSSMENRSSVRVAVGRPTLGESSPRPQRGEGAEDFTHPQVYHTPLIDIHEGSDGLILEADLPGASDENLTIQLEENVLSLHAQIPSPVPEGSRVLHEEYHVVDFYRSFILSDEVDRARITAELKNGVLRLVLPKAERARTRRIEIKSS
jgi:HSP20 family molecular chaperone IbpA